MPESEYRYGCVPRKYYTHCIARSLTFKCDAYINIAGRDGLATRRNANLEGKTMTVIAPPAIEKNIARQRASGAAISPRELHAAASGADEIAVVDVREGSRYASGHVSVAVELTVSEIELRAPILLPRKTVKIVVTDDDGGAGADRAVQRLRQLGYTDVQKLDGGIAAWRAAGLELITGLNSLSKALGEFVERRYHTPKIDAQELKRRIDAGGELVILDTRPLDEFHHISIPGGVAAPGAELLYRAFDAVSSSTTPVVINCAGRTRAIIGAQALRNAGFPNPVVSLENGTAAWLLAGYEPGRGADDIAPAPSAQGLEQARQAADRIAQRFPIEKIDAAGLARWRAESEKRSLYLLDVRTAEEFSAGHLPGSRSAPGGQIVQATDKFVGTRQGRIVLVDNPDAVRATITASWLVQLGLEQVAVYAADTAEFSERGPQDRPPVDPALTGATIDVLSARDLIASGQAVVLDLEPAPPYFRERHYLPGSYVARRSALAETLAGVPGSGTIILTSSDGDIARLAAGDTQAAGERKIVALAGGTQAWIDAGLAHRSGLDQPALDPAHALPPLPDLDQRRVILDAYVKWGDVITEQLERDGLVRFRAFD
jgi:rhodanese-related sulfurtransferase